VPDGVVDPVADRVVEMLLRNRCSTAFLVAYEDVAGESWLLADAVFSRLRAAGVDIIDQVVARDGRVHYPREDGPLSDVGDPLPTDDRVPAVADFIARGRRPAASRGELEEWVGASAQAPADVVAAVRRLLPGQALGVPVDLTAVREPAIRAWGGFLSVEDDSWFGAEPAATAAQIAAMLVGLADRDLRDLVIGWLCPGQLDGSELPTDLLGWLEESFPARDWQRRDAGSASADDEQCVARLQQRLCWLARQAPEDHAPGVLTVLAAYAWHCGDGALTNSALDRALRIDPSYRLALLLQRVVELGLREEHPAVPPARRARRARSRAARRWPAAG